MKTNFKVALATLLFSQSFSTFGQTALYSAPAVVTENPTTHKSVVVAKIPNTGKPVVTTRVVDTHVGAAAAKPLHTNVPLLTTKVSGMSKSETFYGNNISQFNNNNYTDQVWFLRATTDVNFDVIYEPGVGFRISMRNKNSAGIPESSGRTGIAETKLLDAVNREHNHPLTLQFFWMRECWLDFSLAHLLGLDFSGSHNFKIGLFPFEVGRGISLGSAYAVGPEPLGFYTSVTIDQYAFGALLTGDLINDRLTYDLYTAILQNKSGTLGDTNAKIFGQEIGRIARAERGFGQINFVVAGRLQWNVFKSDRIGKLTIEPYMVYNSDPEQKIEFRGDSSSKLGTIGYAVEYAGPYFELGFDSGFNIGQQRVKGWDRNQVIEKNIGGSVVLVNSHVVDQDGNNILFVANSASQKVIDNTTESEESNGMIIGTVGDTTLSNNKNRFRDAYNNQYQGWMAVFDGLAWMYKKDLSIAIAAGVASGDDNPNIDTQDRVYSGFIGLQEIYSGGSRVRSAFVLGGAGKVPRPLSQPTSNQAPNPFSNQVSGFTNLVFGGTGIKWAPQGFKHRFTVHPNLISYWQHYQTKAYSAKLARHLDCNASAHLGVEGNLFFDYYPSKNVKLFGVGSIFVPGQHYADIKGMPLNREQQRVIEEFNRTGFDETRTPNVSDNVSYTFNIGLQFNF